MNIVIRSEEDKEYRRVEEIASEAFCNLYFPGAHDHYIVHKMSEHEDFIKELTFIIEVNDKVEGAIFYSNSKIVEKEGAEYKTISFGPVFISPEYQRKGLGRKLITYSIEEAKRLGYSVITTLGYPYHYKPYGFLGGKKYAISMPDMNYYTGLLVLPLYEGALDGVSGYAEFSDCFEVSSEEVDKFDKNFLYKDKRVQECQEEYEEACCEVDELEYL